MKLPLTTSEIWLNLIWPCTEARKKWLAHKRRWNQPPSGSFIKEAACSLHEIEAVLAGNSWLRYHLSFFQGFWYLKRYSNTKQVRERMKHYLTAREKWRYLMRLVPVLHLVPFVRAVAVTGSLSTNNAHPQSDLDLFFLVQRGRIWTARFGATALTQLLGIRRLPAGRVTRNKLCLNHYIAWPPPEMSKLEVVSLYTAYEFSRLVSLWGSKLLADFRLRHAEKLRRFLMHIPSLRVLSPRLVVRGHWLRKAALAVEWALQRDGGRSEHFLARIQRRKISRHAKGERDSSMVIASDTRLAFHPNSHAQYLWRAYVDMCARAAHAWNAP